MPLNLPAVPQTALNQQQIRASRFNNMLELGQLLSGVYNASQQRKLEREKLEAETPSREAQATHYAAAGQKTLQDMDVAAETMRKQGELEKMLAGVPTTTSVEDPESWQGAPWKIPTKEIPRSPIDIAKEKSLIEPKFHEVVKELREAKPKTDETLVDVPGIGKLPVGQAYHYMPKEEKEKNIIERTVDLGDKVEYIYSNGTREIKPKGTSPNIIMMGDQRDFRNESAMRKEFLTLPEVKEYPTIETNSKRALKALESTLDSPTNVAIDQTIITTFNKMLDPSSVVRESEYARTPQDMALFNRIKGKWDKITTGGAGLTADERQAMYRMIGNFRGIASQQYNDQVDYYSELSKRYGYKPENVVRLGGRKGSSDSDNKITPVPKGGSKFKILGVE